MPKMIILIEVASKPKKKYHHHGAQCMPKMIIFIQGASKPKKKVSSALNKFYDKNDHFHRWGSKKPQKLITTQKKVSAWLNRFHVIPCQKWSLSSKMFKNTSKHLKNCHLPWTFSPPHLQLSLTDSLYLKKKTKTFEINKKTQKITKIADKIPNKSSLWADFMSKIIIFIEAP